MLLLMSVTPGSLDHVRPRPPFPENQLFPGFVFKELILEVTYNDIRGVS